MGSLSSSSVKSMQIQFISQYAIDGGAAFLAVAEMKEKERRWLRRWLREELKSLESVSHDVENAR